MSTLAIALITLSAIVGVGMWMSYTDWRNARRRRKGQPEIAAFTHGEP